MVVQSPLLTSNGVQTQIAGIFASAAAGVIVGHGLIVGQRSLSASGNDHAIYLARTPMPDEPLEGLTPIQIQNKIGGPDIDVEWMSEHTKQVTRMLPGGLRVLGILLVDGTEVTNSADTFAFKKKVEKMLETVETINGKTTASDPDYQGGDITMYVLNVNRASNFVKLQSVQFQVDSMGNICKGAEVKWKLSAFKQAVEDVTNGGPWQKVRANFILDYPVVFSPIQTEELTLSGKVDVAMKKINESVSRATILFDGMSRVHNSNGNYLDPTIKESTSGKKDGGKKSKGKSSRRQRQETEESQDDTEHKIKEYTADILLSDCPSLNEEITEEAESRLKLGGRMCVRVYMRPKATIKETSNAIKEDILRSLRARLEMHCDSLVGEETMGTEKQDTPVVHEPPRRCLIGMPQRAGVGDFENPPEAESVMISDFLFPGETSYDSIESVREVFGFEAHIGRMDDDQELVAGIQHLNVNSSGELTVGNVNHTVPSEDGKTAFGSPSKLATDANKHSNYNMAAIILSVLVAIAGVIVSYLAMSTGTNAPNEEEFSMPSKTQDHHPTPEE